MKTEELNIEELKQEAYKIEQELKNEFEEISDFIFNNPELGEKEFISSKFLVETMQKHNFKTIYPYCSIPTAFLAEYGDEGETTISFAAEYDALPGYGVNGNQNAHACGHNWIAASTAGAAIVLSKLKQKYNFKGKIVLIGTPAEETTGGKIDLIKAGAFDNIDFCLQPHIGEKNDISCFAQALDSLEFKFKGRATHAAATPYEGINALDAVMLTFAGINALRQHVKTDVRIHGIVSDGGLAANIIPERAACKIMVRAKERKDLQAITQKVINIAKGAELMTGALMTYSPYENPFDNLINVPALVEMTKRNLEDAGINDICLGQPESGGSSDIGNVSYVCPTQYMELALNIPEKVNVHEEGIIKYVNSKEAYDIMHKAVNVMAGIAIELYLDQKKVSEIKLWHKNKVR